MVYVEAVRQQNGDLCIAAQRKENCVYITDKFLQIRKTQLLP